MEVWAWIGFGSAVVVVFFIMLWLVAKITSRLHQTTQGFVMLACAMTYTGVLTWHIAEKILCSA